MKNPIAPFIVFILLSLSGLVLACGPLPPVPDGGGAWAASAPASQGTSGIPSTRVRIVHSWIDHKDGAAYHHSEFGLGTVVGASIILTHNHFDFPSESRESEALTFTAPAGQVFTLAMAAVAAVAVDAGTQVIYIPGYVALAAAPLGDQTSLDQLAGGVWLRVDYWDEASQHFAQGNFQVQRLEQGVATLSDPLCVVRPGDSGGGVYLEGKLIGNTWAMYADPDTRQPTGVFNVALLPAEAMRLLQPEQMNTLSAIRRNTPAAASERQ